MSQNSNFLKTTTDLIETDPEIKSFIYQQIHDFSSFITPETLVLVIARDPQGTYASSNAENSDAGDLEHTESIASESTEQDLAASNYKYRIAVILKEEDSSIEAEAFHNDIFEAIKMAKEKLLTHLIEIREEIESPQDRIKAIKVASDNTQIH